MNNLRISIEQSLLEKNIFIIDGDITRDTAVKVKQFLTVMVFIKNSPRIVVIIDSNGGNKKPGIEIYDALLMYPGKKIALVLGKADSMAAIILQAFDHRIITEHSTVLIHNLSIGNIEADVLLDEELRQNFIYEVAYTRTVIQNIVKTKTRKTSEEVGKEFNKNKPMNATKALKFGLVDCIVKDHNEFINYLKHI